MSDEFNKERALFISIAEGNETAFRELFHIYSPLLYPMILKVTKAEDITEDILQETFLKLWISRDKLPQIENPKAWILRIAYFQAFTFLRRKGIHQKAVDKLYNKAHSKLLRSDVEEAVEWSTLQRAVRKAISQLPAQQKKVFQLSREEGLKIREIAIQLQLSEQTVKNTLSRSLKFIRESLEKAGHPVFLTILFVLLFLQQK